MALRIDSYWQRTRAQMWAAFYPSSPLPLAIAEGLAILAKYGIEAHLFIPGVGKVNGIDAQNFLESTFVTPSTVNTPVGGVKNASGGTINLTQATTANKPLLGIEPMGGRRNVLIQSETFNVSPWSSIANHTYTSVPTTAPVKLTKITVATASIATQSVTAAATSCVVSWIVRGVSSTNTLLLRNSTTATNLTECTINPDYTQSTGADITVEQLGDNVRKISITYATGITVGDSLAVYLGTDSGVGDWTEFGGVQLSWGTTIYPYQRTLSAYEAYEDGKDSIYYWQKGASAGWLSGTPLFDGTVRDYLSIASFRPSARADAFSSVFVPCATANGSTVGAVRGEIRYDRANGFVRLLDGDGARYIDLQEKIDRADQLVTASVQRAGNTVTAHVNGSQVGTVTRSDILAITPVMSRVLCATDTNYPLAGKGYCFIAVQATVPDADRITLATMADYISGRVR